MSTFDRKICVSNIYFLTKALGKKLGDVEIAAGVSPGYFSRFNREESTGNPSVEVLASVSDQLGVTLDALMSRDYSVMSESEKYVMRFLDKLIMKSNSGDTVWERDTKSYIESLGANQDGYAIHPLFENRFDEYTGGWRCCYNSLFFPGYSYHVVGDCFRLCIDERQTFYLMKVEPIETPEAPFDDDKYELYLVKKGRPETICCSCIYGNCVFAHPLKKLYEAAILSSRHVKLSKNVRNAIDSFMIEPQSLGVDDLDGELPF